MAAPQIFKSNIFPILVVDHTRNSVISKGILVPFDRRTPMSQLDIRAEAECITSNKRWGSDFLASVISPVCKLGHEFKFDKQRVKGSLIDLFHPVALSALWNVSLNGTGVIFLARNILCRLSQIGSYIYLYMNASFVSPYIISGVLYRAIRSNRLA